MANVLNGRFAGVRKRCGHWISNDFSLRARGPTVKITRRLRGLIWYILSMIAILSPLLVVIILVIVFAPILDIR